MVQQYKAPPDTPSSVGYQMRDFHYAKKALWEAREEQYFLPMADVISMPKHMGKKIKRYHYLAILDDANINDQGLDGAGAVIANGNLYGSSKDVATIADKFPLLTENGGAVNRVGMTRKEIEGTITKYGFHSTYTQESMDFDSDSELKMHMNREMLNAASDITEDNLQLDLLNNAGVIRYPGAATSIDTVGTDPVTYRDLLNLHTTLTQNRTPMKTKVFKGTRMIDTVTLPGARMMFIGSELQATMEEMKDLHDEKAFIPVHKYANNGHVMNGEIGTVGYFRIIVVPEMLKWTGGGAAEDPLHYSSNGNLDVFPMLVIGAESFTTIGFQTDGKTVKFTIYHEPPGKGIANLQDPFGEKGYMSIKWYYGFLLQRPERLALVYSSAKL